MTKKLSVIVPVYNSEKHLEKTASAILGGSYSNLELILVDDGSRDGSADICRRISGGDSRAIFIEKQNGGPGSARNAGIEAATGELIAFCDGDDVPSKDMYARLTSLLERYGADVALCDIFSERNDAPLGFPWTGITVFDKEEIQSKLIAAMIGNASDNDPTSPVWGSVCRGVYKTELIRKTGICFPCDIVFAEDLIFSLRYLIASSRAVITDEPLYFYTDNSCSIMNSFFRYRKGMFDERLKLAGYVKGIIKALPDYEMLRKRLYVTERCYYHECIGNACRPQEGRSKSDKLSELNEILESPAVIEAFRYFDAQDRRKKTVYRLIRRKHAYLIYYYYFRKFKRI